MRISNGRSKDERHFVTNFQIWKFLYIFCISSNKTEFQAIIFLNYKKGWIYMKWIYVFIIQHLLKSNIYETDPVDLKF